MPTEVCPFFVHAFTVITENTFSVNCERLTKHATALHVKSRCEYCDSALLICNHCVCLVFINVKILVIETP
jgi:hypothetical protein